MLGYFVNSSYILVEYMLAFYRFKPYAWLLGLITSNTGHHTLVLA